MVDGTILTEYEDIRIALEKECTKEKKAALYTDLMEFIVKISDYMLESEKELRERIGEIMGGQVLKLRSEELREEGREEGMEKGIQLAKQVLLLYAKGKSPEMTFMVGYLLVIKNPFKAGVEKKEIMLKNPSVEYTESDLDLVDIYVSLLEGYDFDLGDDIHFVFGTDGSYSGFFDTNDIKVSDYVYKVLVEDDNIKLNIYNKEETKMVSYCMLFDKKGNIVLKHPDMKKTIKLKF